MLPILLDNLSVWFLGYYPQRYCSLFSCRWQFTLDEFEQAREGVARLEAVVFQDQNALVPLNEAKKALLKQNSNMNRLKIQKIEKLRSHCGKLL
jgi:hypothetical protein